MNKMTRSELIHAMSIHQNDFQKQELEAMVPCFFEAFTQALQEGKSIELRGLGTFFLKERKGRKGVNPKTGTVITVQPKKVPFFRAGKALKTYLNAVPKSQAKAHQGGVKKMHHLSKDLKKISEKKAPRKLALIKTASKKAPPLE